MNFAQFVIRVGELEHPTSFNLTMPFAVFRMTVKEGVPKSERIDFTVSLNEVQNTFRSENLPLEHQSESGDAAIDTNMH